MGKWTLGRMSKRRVSAVARRCGTRQKENKRERERERIKWDIWDEIPTLLPYSVNPQMSTNTLNSQKDSCIRKLLRTSSRRENNEIIAFASLSQIYFYKCRLGSLCEITACHSFNTWRSKDTQIHITNSPFEHTMRPITVYCMCSSFNFISMKIKLTMPNGKPRLWRTAKELHIGSHSGWFIFIFQLKWRI